MVQCVVLAVRLQGCAYLLQMPRCSPQWGVILASIFRVSKLFSSFSSLPAHRTESSHQLSAMAQGPPDPCRGEGPIQDPKPGRGLALGPGRAFITAVRCLGCVPWGMLAAEM